MSVRGPLTFRGRNFRRHCLRRVPESSSDRLPCQEDPAPPKAARAAWMCPLESACEFDAPANQRGADWGVSGDRGVGCWHIARMWPPATASRGATWCRKMRRSLLLRGQH